MIHSKEYNRKAWDNFDKRNGNHFARVLWSGIPCLIKEHSDGMINIIPANDFQNIGNGPGNTMAVHPNELLEEI